MLIFFTENKCKEVPDNYLTKNDSDFAFNMLKFNNSLTNDIVSFEQLGPGMLPFFLRYIYDIPQCLTEDNKQKVVLVLATF